MTSLSEAYRNNPIQFHQIVPLDFHSLKALPVSHAWPPISISNDNLLPSKEQHSSVPIIDLTDPNVVELVGHACETWGIFQVTNHGVPSSLLDGVEHEARRLFNLPAEQKMKVLRSPTDATGYGVARIARFFSKSLWHEGFTIMGSSDDHHARVLWPHDYQSFCNVMELYQKSMKSLSHRILLTILKSLEVYEEELDWASEVHGSGSSGALQLNSYPPCPDPTRAIGLAPHTDSMLLTILHQSATEGLQVFHEGAGWIPVPPVAGALSVNVGDLLQICSNGRFPTAYHRAVVNRKQHRVSAAYFCVPQVDSVVGPFSKLPFPKYRSLTVREYIGIKNKHQGAISMIEI